LKATALSSLIIFIKWQVKIYLDAFNQALRARSYLRVNDLQSFGMASDIRSQKL